MKTWAQLVNTAVVDATAAITSISCAAIRAHLQDAAINMTRAFEAFLEEEENDQSNADREAGKERD